MASQNSHQLAHGWRHRFGFALLAPFVIAAGGCAESRGGTIPYASLGTPDAPSLAPLEATYRIAPLDTLSVKVFKMADLSGDYDVDLMGQISMPLIGAVQAADKTPEELRALLAQRLGAKYLEHPDVSISLKASTRRSVTLDGAINHPGSFPVLGPTTLMQAIAAAGGASPDANPRRTVIFRQIGGKRQAASFDLTAIRHGVEPDPPVYAGDIIIMDGSAIKALQKQVLGSLPFFSIFKPF
jgi:polysaccharide export outer membrane protein